MSHSENRFADLLSKLHEKAKANADISKLLNDIDAIDEILSRIDDDTQPTIWNLPYSGAEPIRAEAWKK